MKLYNGYRNVGISLFTAACMIVFNGSGLAQVPVRLVYATARFVELSHVPITGRASEHPVPIDTGATWYICEIRLDVQTQDPGRA